MRGFLSTTVQKGLGLALQAKALDLPHNMIVLRLPDLQIARWLFATASGADVGLGKNPRNKGATHCMGRRRLVSEVTRRA